MHSPAGTTVLTSQGHDLEAFRMKHQDTEGRLVLEDLPETIQQVGQLHSRIEKRSYNFFLPQPIKGEPFDRRYPSKLTKS